jgi:hypothetical protein
VSFLPAVLAVFAPGGRGRARGRSRLQVALLLLIPCVLLGGCASSGLVTADEQIPRIEYDAQGRIKGLFGLRRPSADPTCRQQEFTADFVNVERDEYLVFQIPSTRRVWVQLEGEMRKMFSDPQDARAREVLSGRRKYKMKAYACDGIGHTNYETVSVELSEQK